MTGRLAREPIDKAIKRNGAEKTHSLTMILVRKKEEEGKPQKPPTETVSPIAEAIEDATPVSKLLKKTKGCR